MMRAITWFLLSGMLDSIHYVMNGYGGTIAAQCVRSLEPSMMSMAILFCAPPSTFRLSAWDGWGGCAGGLADQMTLLFWVDVGKKMV